MSGMDAPYRDEPRSDAVPPRRALFVFGAVLMVVGLAIVVGRLAGVQLQELIGEQSWPFFVIVPGLILLVAAVVPRPPDGLGLAIAAEIVGLNRGRLEFGRSGLGGLEVSLSLPLSA